MFFVGIDEGVGTSTSLSLYSLHMLSRGCGGRRDLVRHAGDDSKSVAATGNISRRGSTPRGVLARSRHAHFGKPRTEELILVMCMLGAQEHLLVSKSVRGEYAVLPSMGPGSLTNGLTFLSQFRIHVWVHMYHCADISLQKHGSTGSASIVNHPFLQGSSALTSIYPVYAIRFKLP
ncbi:hypothetical protein BD779DRAFT_1476073 [Infundibulicybe gibba]|nr:hypothetical protein BD779DRAFT_1476073 [Infundibulicybe gibba]